MSEKTKMMDYSSSPIKLPEELRSLLEQSKQDELECAECYSNHTQWTNMSPNMPELIIKDPTESFTQDTMNSSQTHCDGKEEIKEDHFWKFNEGKTLKAAEDYIKSTYHQHYTSEESKVQVLDIIEAIGDGVPFCRDNLIKYSARFGKKNGLSKLDALKIIHYGILLYNFAGFHKNTTDRYETF